MKQKLTMKTPSALERELMKIARDNEMDRVRLFLELMDRNGDRKVQVTSCPACNSD